MYACDVVFAMVAYNLTFKMTFSTFEASHISVVPACLYMQVVMFLTARGVHPPKPMMHALLFQITPISEHLSESHKKFQDYFFSNKCLSLSTKISKDLFTFTPYFAEYTYWTSQLTAHIHTCKCIVVRFLGSKDSSATDDL